ncbi:MAG TPA: hypothetical protein VLH58_01920 [Candidatus Methylomirabilis sp.]|nr:hypothetical protein [Candidatus Methylomirabilis sp.]HSC70079.1 hypothetical protein [Candidatus Methylomirabilis sp.]
MAGDRGGRGLAALAILISLIALSVSVLAYREVGGDLTLKDQVRSLQGTLETIRKETADALTRIEQAVRPADNSRDVPVSQKR